MQKISLIQIHKRDLSDLYEVAWSEVCMLAFVINNIYDLDSLTQEHPYRIYETEDKLIVAVWENQIASQGLQEDGTAEAHGYGD